MSSDGKGEAVKVAVKVRPFNKRELDMNATLIVEMDGPTTTLKHESGDEKLTKTFTFDYSYWSFKPSYTSAPIHDHYTNNTQVFQDIGKDVLRNAWEGYNCSLFAYGQTGSGKSHSMLGTPDDPGIIPMVSQDIFTQISAMTEEQSSNDEWQTKPEYIVEVSMFEIYNEKIQDLLSGSKQELQVREDPKTGPYVDHLSKHCCSSYSDIKKLNEQGDQARTTGATKMNDKSSRAHTIFQIRFEQKLHKKGMKPTIKLSTICLVDLAGAEKLKTTGATGAQAKEGVNINLSLTNLGICISALAERKKVIPFRSSKLTFILKNMLGGNSKTVMIAAVSPASVNYNESLSTLEYASRAKKIKTQAKINEDENEKLIRTLKEQVAELEQQLALARKGINPSKQIADPQNDKEVQELRAMLARSQEQYQELCMSAQDKMNRTKELEQERVEALKKSGVFQEENFDRKKFPHLINLNEDAYMSERLIYPVNSGVTVVGSKQGSSIFLDGLGIEEEHCTVESVEDNGVYRLKLTPGSGVTYVNGEVVSEPMELYNGFRIIFGSNYVFKLVNPGEVSKISTGGSNEPVDWAFAQKELMAAQYQINSGPSEQELELKRQLEEMERAQKEKEESMKKEKLEMERNAEDMRKKMELQQLELKKQLQAAHSQDQQKLEEMKKQIEEQQRQMKQQLELQRKELELKQHEAQKKLEEQKRQLEAEVEVQKEKDQLRMLLEERVAKLIPMVNEANSIAKKLKKPIRFELKILFEQSDESKSSRSTLGVQVSDDEGVIAIWAEDEFINRVYLMQELYQEYVNTIDTGSKFDLDNALDGRDDPFEDEEAMSRHQLLGTCRVFLKTLAHNIEYSSYTPILDFKGKTEGEVKVAIIPLDKNGKSEAEGADIEMYSDPMERVGDPVYFKIVIQHARGLKAHYCRDVQIRYKFFLETDDTESVICATESINAEINFEKFYHFKVATKDFVQYLQTKMFVIHVYGKRVLTEKQKKTALEKEERKKVNTAELLEKLKMLESERDQVLSDLDIVHHEKEELEKTNQDLKTKLAESTNALNVAAQTPRDDGRSERLEKDLAILSEKRQQEALLLADLEKKLNDLRVELQTKDKQIKELLTNTQSSASEHKTAVLEKDNNLTTLQTNLEKLAKDHSALSQTHKQTLVELDGKSQEIVQLQEKIRILQEEVSKLKAQLDMADKNVKLSEQQAQHNIRMKDEEISLLNKQMEFLHKQTEKLEQSGPKPTDLKDLHQKNQEILELKQQFLDAQQAKDKEVQLLKLEILATKQQQQQSMMEISHSSKSEVSDERSKHLQEIQQLQLELLESKKKIIEIQAHGNEQVQSVKQELLLLQKLHQEQQIEIQKKKEDERLWEKKLEEIKQSYQQQFSLQQQREQDISKSERGKDEQIRQLQSEKLELERKKDEEIKALTKQLLESEKKSSSDVNSLYLQIEQLKQQQQLQQQQHQIEQQQIELKYKQEQLQIRQSPRETKSNDEIEILKRKLQQYDETIKNQELLINQKQTKVCQIM